MNCFPCFSSKKEEDTTGDSITDDNKDNKNDDFPIAAAQPSFIPPLPQQVCTDNNNRASSSVNDDDKDEPFDADEGVNSAKAFTFRELASAAKNFRQECLIGEGRFGRVFRGTLQSSGQVVAVRKLDRSGTQGSKEFEVDVLMLSLRHHPNLVRLVGYCAEGDQRLLVYEYMPSGPLEKHLFDIPADKKPLNWSARMRIASGIAQGLEYLHEKANPAIIYRDLKSSNILLDETNNPRLSDYGLAKLVQQNGGKMHLSPRTTASGYCAPEYESHGELTLKSDIYSFGVVLLELISGRRALDSTRPTDEENLVTWAQPIFRDPKRFPDMADPLLKGQFAVTSLNQVVGVAAMCLQEEPMVRPMISDVVAALSFLAMAPPNAPIPARLAPILSTRVETLSQPVNDLPSLEQGSVSKHKKDDSSDSEEDEDEDEDEEDQELHPNDDNDEDKQEDQNSDLHHSDSLELDSENKKGITGPDQNKSSKKLKESAKWSSSSKRKSRVKTEGKRSITSSSGNGSSFGSIDSSVGFSLRCDSTYPERNFHSDSRQDYHSGSSSDEESNILESFKSSSGRNTRFKSINSRNISNKDLHNISPSTNKSSSHKRQYCSEKSSGSHSKKYDNVDWESDDDDESDFVYSRHSSSVGSDYGYHSPKHQD